MCGKLHNGPCATLTGACFGCGEIGHYQNQCPNKVQEDVQVNQRTESANKHGGNNLQARKWLFQSHSSMLCIKVAKKSSFKVLSLIYLYMDLFCIMWPKRISFEDETFYKWGRNVRPAFLSYLLIKYYACWVRRFYFNICQPATATSPKLLIYSTLDPKNKFPKVV